MARQPVWMAKERPRKPRLTRERITRAAVGLLDAEGVAGFSMRALAARLNAGTMSIYEYVRGVEDVYDLAVDEVFAEIEPDTGGSWRDLLTRHLHQSRHMMHRHPWLPALMSVRPLLGPNFLARAELFYAALARAGLRGAQLTAAVGTLTYYVQGFVAAEHMWQQRIRRPDEQITLRRHAQQFLERAADRYPALTHHAQLDNEDFDSQFQLGLDTILDGIQARAAPGT